MATGTNAIALESEVKSITGSSGSITTNLCCTKSRAIALGADSTYLYFYTDNLLVKHSDIVKKIITPVEYYCYIQISFMFTSPFTITWNDQGVTNCPIRGYFGKVDFELNVSNLGTNTYSSLYKLGSNNIYIASQAALSRDLFYNYVVPSENIAENLVNCYPGTLPGLFRYDLNLNPSYTFEVIINNSSLSINNKTVDISKTVAYITQKKEDTGSYGVWLPPEQVTVQNGYYYLVFIFENLQLANLYMN